MDPDEISTEEFVTRMFNTAFIEKDGLENTPVYAAWIACQLTRLAASLKDDDVSAECVALRAETLMGVEPLHLDWALKRARHECVRLPCPAEVFDFLKEIPGFTMPVDPED